MRYLSVCSGIEAASCAWHPLGWRPVAFSEIGAFPSAVLAERWPEVPNLGDMTQFHHWPNYESVDVLVGGTPCQSFSIAGLRGGLDDPRGNLCLTYLAIAARYRPYWLVWENVPGVLSNNGGRDFGTFLGGLAKLGYGFAYRVFDAQYIRVESHPRAVPQRRRRVFVVGCLGGWRSAAAVLFERASMRGDSPPSRRTREAIAAAFGQDPSRDSGAGVAGAVSCKWAKGSGGPAGDECYNLTVANTLTTACRKNDRGGPDDNHVIAFGAQVESPFQDCALTVTGRKGDPGMIAFDTTNLTNPDNRSNPQPGDPCHSLTKHSHPPAIAFRACGQDGFTPDTICPPLMSSKGGGAGVPSIAFQERGRPEGRTIETSEEVAYSVLAGTGGGRTSEMRVSTPSYRVRRLTPGECEALQGFEQGYTAIRYKKKKAADTPRYEALGNSMAVNVMRHIGNRIAAVDAIISSSSPLARSADRRGFLV